MPRKKKEEVVVANEEVEEIAAPAKKPGRKPRAKKEDVAAAEKPARKPRAPRKKAVVPTFVIQNSADNGITYESVVKKVQTAIQVADISSIDIYVKAEEGKAYYVVNGETNHLYKKFYQIINLRRWADSPHCMYKLHIIIIITLMYLSINHRCNKVCIILLYSLNHQLSQPGHRIIA